MVFARSPLGDPALDAAGFLRRLAFIILMIVAPVAELVSHGLLYVLFPIGAAVLVIAGLLVGGQDAPRRIITALRTPIGMAASFLVFWSALSIIWTPFPGDAAARLGRTMLTAGFAMFAIISLPERTKISNIYLLPIGIAITAALTLPMALFGPAWFREGHSPDYILAQRCIMSLAMLLWPAFGALAMREHFIMAAALAVLAAAATLAGFVQIALVALMVAALIYVAAMGNPSRVARIMATSFAILFLGAPLFVALLHPVFILAHAPFTGPIGVFSDLVVHEWLRFVTGHGLNMMERGIDIGLLPPDTPHSIIFMLWYELGIVGVVGFVMFLTAVLLAVSLLPLHAAPAFLAVIATGLVIAIFGAETTQLWWLTLNGVAAIALALLVKAHPRSKRLPAPAANEEDAIDDAFRADQEPDF